MRLATGAAYWVLAKRYSEAYREEAETRHPNSLGDVQKLDKILGLKGHRSRRILPGELGCLVLLLAFVDAAASTYSHHRALWVLRI